jgi:hypothetical protein
MDQRSGARLNKAVLATARRARSNALQLTGGEYAREREQRSSQLAASVQITEGSIIVTYRLALSRWPNPAQRSQGSSLANCFLGS